MALTIEFEEEFKSSRSIDISESSFTQDFVMFICGNFLDEAIDTEHYGPDDDLVALAAAYSIVPPNRTMPLYEGGYIFLTLSSLRVEQIASETWKLNIGYAAKPQDQDPGNSPGSPGPNQGDREQWTNNFVQLSFNVAAQQEQKSMSLQLVDIKKNIGFGNNNVPYIINQRCPVGHTEDGVEGDSVYVRSFNFSITAYFRPADLTFAYVRRLYRMATTINNASFFGFPAGSVLFIEASASGDLYSVVPVTFDFLMRPNFKLVDSGTDDLMDPDDDDEANMYDIQVDPYFEEPTVVTPWPGGALSGWTTLDYRYLHTVDETAKMTLQKPVLRLIHRQYYASDFSKFNL